MKTISKNIQLFQDFVIEEKQLDKSERSLTSYVSAKTIDRDNDIVLPEGIDLNNYKKNPVVLFNHNWNLPAVGTSLWQKPDDKGLLAKTKFGTTDFADDIYTLNVEDILRSWSIGFYPKTWAFDEDSGITTFTGIELLEYSSVNIPSNTDALNEAKKLVKSAEAHSIITAKEVDLKSQMVVQDLQREVKELQDAFVELKNAKDIDLLSDFEKLENKVAYLEKAFQQMVLSNVQKNFKPGEILAGIDVKSIVSGNITRAKENK